MAEENHGGNYTGLKHRNSQQNHISVDGCNAATISNLDIRAPAESPNTDGIDISGSTHIRIHDCLVATGDDCIAIKAGTSNVNISNIACGPGHGISIGSLGEDGNDDQVEGISITNSNFTRTENGVRIKTWQGGSGFAKNITFSGITFIAVDNPIIIDQHYCPHKKCADKSTSAVKISDVKYSGLHGSSISKTATINFSCSTTVPCTNIVMDDVDIESADQSHHSATAYCTNAQGKAHAVHPSVNCLINY
ncbi:UNVERIFIED_CONTAM: putative polygalacturonase [Sesamum radiatum]|uniref:Polygalacturonase n=1 Tax=Sesamum radiatum TaxID=300843 RepID=A0AAW2RF78_SESRA